jgi:hypothetical protein
MAKVVVDFDDLDDARDRFGPERGNDHGDGRMALAKILSQFVVERANSVVCVDGVLAVMVGAMVMLERIRSRRPFRRRWMRQAMGWILIKQGPG